MTNSTNVIAAVRGGLIVGAVHTDQYMGAEYPWPNGWRELLDVAARFDQVDVKLPTEESANLFVRNYADRVARGEVLITSPMARVLGVDIQDPTPDLHPLHLRAPRRKGQCREIKVLGHRDPRGPDNSVTVWVDGRDRLHIRVLKADRCYRFSGMIDTQGFVEIVAK